MDEERLYWVWFSQCFSYGSNKINQFLNVSTDVRMLCLGGEAERKKYDFFTPQDLRRMEKTSLERAQLILTQCHEEEIRVICWLDAEYPQRLRDIYGAPAVLYLKGSLEGLDSEVAIAVVGTRQAIGYTKGVTGNLCYQLARAGAVIISGCAVGIDEYAHRGTIKAKGKTIAVLGCGVDVNYPSQNHGLKEQILHTGGVLVSELPPGTNPDGKYFPTRNRLLAGLSLGVFVTHAPDRSGSLITAELAVEQGKEVFCLPPYDIFDPSCTGVVPFLRDGAKAVFHISDILEEYNPYYSDRIDLKALAEGNVPIHLAAESLGMVADQPIYQKTKREATEESAARSPICVEPPPVLDELQQKLYDALDIVPRQVDELIKAAGLKPYQALATMTELELMGLCQAHPGRCYSRIR